MADTLAFSDSCSPSPATSDAQLSKNKPFLLGSWMVE